MPKWAIVCACAVVAVLVLGFTLLRPSEEERIRKVIDRLAVAVSVKPNDNVLIRMGRIKSELKETVTEDVHVDVPDLNIRVSNRAQLAERATQAGLVFQSAQCTFVGMTIKVEDEAQVAKADALAVVTGERGGARRVDKRSVHFLLRKDGDWRVTTIDVAPATAE